MAFSFISNLWIKWNIRGFVILSLLLQALLFVFAPLRKKITNRYIMFLLWLAYLMADWVSAFTIGLISHNQGNSCTRIAEVDIALQVFWASFLLLHLGGPDTITAFSLEDSSLWQRHLLSLLFQVGAAIYVFVQIFPSNMSLLIPTMLVFIAGVIKNAERLLALYLSSLPRLREWMLLSLRRLRKRMPPNKSSRDAYRWFLEELEDGYSNEEEVKLAESIVVKHAYCFFQIFMFFLTDLIFRCPECEMSRKYFDRVSATDALRLISAELNFIYELLHTKVSVIRSKRSYIFRFIAFIDITMAFILFNRLKKHQLPELDVKITYFLLFGGIALDVIAMFMLVFSDWTVAEVKWYNVRSSRLDSFVHKLVSATDNLRKPQFAKCEAEPNATSKVFLSTYAILDTPLIFRRWSESISACNLLSESLKENPRKIYKPDRRWGIIAFSSICSFPFGMDEKIISCFHQVGETIARGFGIYGIIPMIANTKYVSNNPFIKDLWIFIFKEVKRKSENPSDPTDGRKIFEARCDLFLNSKLEEIDCSNLLEYVTQANYDVSIIIWHLAIEIWYNREKQFMSPTTRNDEREFSKILSDYMLYLLLNQPNVVTSVAGIAQVTSAGTVLELRKYIMEETKDVERLCETLYEVPFNSGSRGWISPLREGIYLAREMEKLREMKWKVMSGVWVEMLSYAALHTKGDVHVQVLSKGGELLAFVWLFMAHFGCFYKSEWGRNDEPLGQWSKWFDF